MVRTLNTNEIRKHKHPIPIQDLNSVHFKGRLVKCVYARRCTCICTNAHHYTYPEQAYVLPANIPPPSPDRHLLSTTGIYFQNSHDYLMFMNTLHGHHLLSSVRLNNGIALYQFFCHCALSTTIGQSYMYIPTTFSLENFFFTCQILECVQFNCTASAGFEVPANVPLLLLY